MRKKVELSLGEVREEVGENLWNKMVKKWGEENLGKMKFYFRNWKSEEVSIVELSRVRGGLGYFGEKGFGWIRVRGLDGRMFYLEIGKGEIRLGK